MHIPIETLPTLPITINHQPQAIPDALYQKSENPILPTHWCTPPDVQGTHCLHPVVPLSVHNNCVCWICWIQLRGPKGILFRHSEQGTVVFEKGSEAFTGGSEGWKYWSPDSILMEYNSSQVKWICIKEYYIPWSIIIKIVWPMLYLRLLSAFQRQTGVMYLTLKQAFYIMSF